MTIVTEPSRLGLIYTNELRASWGKDTEKVYRALFIKLCKFQSMMIITN